MPYTTHTALPEEEPLEFLVCDMAALLGNVRERRDGSSNLAEFFLLFLFVAVHMLLMPKMCEEY